MQKANFSVIDKDNNDSNSNFNCGTNGNAVMVLCSKLRDHPLRLNSYDEIYIRELEVSISRHGLFNPLLVRPLSDGYFQIVSGHYRFRAVLRLKWEKCPVTIIDCDDITAKALLITSNSSGRYFSAIEEGLIIRNLHEQDKLDLKGIGKLFNKSKSWVSRRLSLILSLEESVQDDVQKGLLKARAAQEIALLPRGNQKAFAQCIKKNHLNKDEASTLVQILKNAGFDEKTFDSCINNPRVYIESRSKTDQREVTKKPENTPPEIVAVINAVNRTNFNLQQLITFIDVKFSHLPKDELDSFKKVCSKLNLTVAEFSRTYMKVTLNRF